MDPSTSGTLGEYSRTTAFNRSLSLIGRIVFLLLIVSNVMIVATGFTFAGAWLIMPFAGIEIAALAIAFHLISLRDGDFERLTIAGQAVCLEVSERGIVSRVEFNRTWAQLVRRMDRSGCRLTLRSHGVEVAIGRLMKTTNND